MRDSAQICFAVVLGLSVSVLADDKKPSDIERMEGLWQATAGEANGSALPADVLKKIQVKIDGGTLQTLFDGKANSPKNQIKLTEGKLKGIDLIANEGDEKGQVRDRGIYEFDGERLKICIHEGSGPGKGKEWERPTSFKTEKGTKLVIMVLERVKK